MGLRATQPGDRQYAARCVRGVVYAVKCRDSAGDAATGAALAAGAKDVGNNDGWPLWYNAKRDQLLRWEKTLIAYKPRGYSGRVI